MHRGVHGQSIYHGAYAIREHSQSALKSYALLAHELVLDRAIAAFENIGGGHKMLVDTRCPRRDLFVWGYR